MAVPRPLLLTLLGSFLLAATLLATHNAQTTSEKTAQRAPDKAQAPAPAPAPSQPAKPGSLDARQAVNAIAAPGQKLSSARFRLRVAGGRDALTVAGAFSRGGPQPSFDVRIRERDNGRSRRAHLIATGGRAYAARGTGSYQLGPFTIRSTSRVRAALKGGAKADPLPAPDVAAWMRGLKAAPGRRLDGVETTRVSGRVDAKRVAADLNKLVKSSAPGTRLPRAMDARLQRALKRARLAAYVGTQDQIARRVGLTGTGFALELELSQVNKPQQVTAPARLSKRSLGRRSAHQARELYLASSVALDPPASLAQMGVRYLRLSLKARAAQVPRRVDAAIREHRRVVIFFTQSGGVDDTITARAVRSLRRRSRTAVLSDNVNHVGAYGQVVQKVGVTRTPSIVIIDRRGRARLIEGYIDPDALAQEVADTR